MEIERFDPNNAQAEIEQIDHILARDLSEPYSQYVYQYFLTEWPDYTFLVRDKQVVIGAIVASVKLHKGRKRGYIAMLAVDKAYRGQGIAKRLIARVLDELRSKGADEVTLETEVDNEAALGLYQNFGFVRSRRMHRYYLNTSDAFRLSLAMTEKSAKSTIYPSAQ